MLDTLKRVIKAIEGLVELDRDSKDVLKSAVQEKHDAVQKQLDEL